MSAAPHVMPIYLGAIGSLQYFADVRRANASVDERLAIFFQKFDANINEQIAASERPRRSPRAAARSFNLESCFRMGEG